MSESLKSLTLTQRADDLITKARELRTGAKKWSLSATYDCHYQRMWFSHQYGFCVRSFPRKFGLEPEIMIAAIIGGEKVRGVPGEMVARYPLERSYKQTGIVARRIDLPMHYEDAGFFLAECADIAEVPFEMLCTSLEEHVDLVSRLGKRVQSDMRLPVVKQLLKIL